MVLACPLAGEIECCLCWSWRSVTITKGIFLIVTNDSPSRAFRVKESSTDTVALLVLYLLLFVKEEEEQQFD